jgi:lipid-binding SYLF domain-containing protein
MKSSIIAFGLVIGIFSFCALAAENTESKRVESSTSVLKDVQAIPDKTIPTYLFEKAEGIAIIPGVLKGAFGLGGRWGKGVIMVRTENGTWSDPCFITLAGGSFGWQIGGQSTDFVLVFRTKRSIEGVESGKLTLGADASVTAGPVGRNAEASTDVQLKAEIYSYAKSRGLFAGVSIEGTSLSIDDNANAAFYDSKDVNAKTIFAGKMPKEPASAAKLHKALTDLSTGKTAAADSAKSGSAK